MKRLVFMGHQVDCEPVELLDYVIAEEVVLLPARWVREAEGCASAVTVRTVDVEPSVLHIERRLIRIVDQVGGIMVGVNEDDPYRIRLREQPERCPQCTIHCPGKESIWDVDWHTSLKVVDDLLAKTTNGTVFPQQVPQDLWQRSGRQVEVTSDQVRLLQYRQREVVSFTG
jgi:hypothetical protein